MYENENVLKVTQLKVLFVMLSMSKFNPETFSGPKPSLVWLFS